MKLPWYLTLIAVLFCFPTILFAQPMFVAETEGIKILLTDDPCELKGVVANPPLQSNLDGEGQGVLRLLGSQSGPGGHGVLR